MNAIRYAFAAVTLALLVSGFFLQKRSRSPYAGAPMDAEALARHRRGELLALAGSVAFLIYLFLER